MFGWEARVGRVIRSVWRMFGWEAEVEGLEGVIRSAWWMFGWEVGVEGAIRGWTTTYICVGMAVCWNLGEAQSENVISICFALSWTRLTMFLTLDRLGTHYSKLWISYAARDIVNWCSFFLSKCVVDVWLRGRSGRWFFVVCGVWYVVDLWLRGRNRGSYSWCGRWCLAKRQEWKKLFVVCSRSLAERQECRELSAWLRRNQKSVGVVSWRNVMFPCQRWLNLKSSILCAFLNASHSSRSKRLELAIRAVSGCSELSFVFIRQ